MKRTALLIVSVLAVAAVAAATLLLSCGARPKPEMVTMFHWDFEVDRDGPIYRRIRDRVGVEIEPVSVPWSEWAGKLNVMIASGDVPDVFVTYGPGDPDAFDRLARDGLLLPLSGYLERYPNIAARLAGRENQRIDGEYYAVPVTLPKSDHVGMIRGDWLDRLGLPVPSTVEELRQTARAFKKELGVIPISSSPPHTAGFFWLNPLLYAFGGGWDTWLPDGSGGYLMCWVSEGNREALRFINGLYHEGLLDPEFFSNTDAEKMDRFLSGRAGIVFHNTISLYTDRLQAIDPGARIDIFEPPAGPSGQRGEWAMDGFFTAVSVNSRLPERKRDRVLQLLDFLYSREGLELLRYGVEGVHYQVREGRKVPLLPHDGEVYRRLEEVDRTASLRSFVELGDIWSPEWDRNHDLIRRAVANGEKHGRVPLFLYDKTPAERKHRKQLTDLAFQSYVTLVQSDTFDRDWQAFVDKWYAYGGREMTAERNGKPFTR